MGLLGGTPPTAGADSGRLFAAGVTYICCRAWPLAYDCFTRSTREDAPTRYNLALCCFHVGWYEESYRLLAEAERLLDDKPGQVPSPGVPSMSRRAASRGFPPLGCRERIAPLSAASRDAARRCPHADPPPASRGCLSAGPLRGGADDCRPPRTPIRTS